MSISNLIIKINIKFFKKHKKSQTTSTISAKIKIGDKMTNAFKNIT